ncbi:MAG: N-acetylmuramoyl-L-alanine amidase [Thermodesulfovibrionia bacterium]|nr:N-acetylmuramoyl-L-alanine amidase [Thermodesulfovibrionia bacterium]
MAIQQVKNIHTLVIHCSATPEGVDFDVEDIDQWHKAKGWNGCGYHKVFLLDGTVQLGRPYSRRGAHVLGNNINTIGWCMIGGVDHEGNVKNTFTEQQFDSVFAEIQKDRHILRGLVRICGHRDYSPDLNGDGLITPNEFMKGCPSWDVQRQLPHWGLAKFMVPTFVDEKDLI